MRRGLAGRLSSILYASLCAALCTTLPLAAAAQNGNPLESDATAITAGRGMFAARCAVCHGADALGATGPDLTQVWARGQSDEHVFESVRNGIEGSVMPPSQAPDEEIWAIAAYLRSISTVAPFESTGDPEAGEALFTSSCARCHRVGNGGGAIGPDLSRIAFFRSRESLVRSIRDPSATVAEGYRAVTIVTRNGERIEGLARSEDAFSIQIVDTDARLQGYRKGDLADLVHEKDSLMPKFGRLRLNDNELEDVLAFLLAQRNAGLPSPGSGESPEESSL